MGEAGQGAREWSLWKHRTFLWQVSNHSHLGAPGLLFAAQYNQSIWDVELGEAPSWGDCEPAKAMKKSCSPILSTVYNLAVISCALTKLRFCFFFFFFGVFIPSFLLNLSPASLPSSSENSRGKLRQSVPFPQDFPSAFCCPSLLHSSPTLEFLPEMRTICIARICRSLLIHELLSNSLIWWGETKHCNPTIFCSEKNLTWSFSFKTYVWRSCPLTSRVAQKVPCHTSNSNSLLRNVHKSHFQPLLASN